MVSKLWYRSRAKSLEVKVCVSSRTYALRVNGKTVQSLNFEFRTSNSLKTSHLTVILLICLKRLLHWLVPTSAASSVCDLRRLSTLWTPQIIGADEKPSLFLAKSQLSKQSRVIVRDCLVKRPVCLCVDKLLMRSLQAVRLLNSLF